MPLAKPIQDMLSLKQAHVPHHCVQVDGYKTHVNYGNKLLQEIKKQYFLETLIKKMTNQLSCYIYSHHHMMNQSMLGDLLQC